jgi:signal transduction histidine kinase
LANALKQRNQLAVVAPRSPSRQTSLSDRIAAIAELGAATVAAERCAIAFPASGAGASEMVCAPRGESRWDAVVNAVLSALANRLGDAAAGNGMKRARRAPGSIESIERIALGAREIDAIVRVEKIDGRQIAASAFIGGASAVRIATVAPADCARGELEASLELMARAVFAEMELAAAGASLEFWRTHGAESGRQAVAAKRELERELAATNHLEQAVAAARRAQPNERFSRFGELVAGASGFDQWLVAVAEGGGLTRAASSSELKEFDLGETGGALGESFRRRIVIARWRDRDAAVVDRAEQSAEDRSFVGSYVCIPFEAGVIALASRDGRASATTAQAIVERLAPLATNWVMEREAARRSLLMRQLALRMFAAVDEERARIARDLHDDQAQLLAAAKIALDGRREAARSIFTQVEQELRRKTRELRPATIGDASLDQAIEQEFARLHRAGVKAKFSQVIHGGAAQKISRPVQQLCFQFVREALSNVIRHARAKSVQVTIDSTGTAARVSVTDDGCGIAASVKGEGTGLAGVRERLELTGGSLTVKSRAGRTTVVAEIPEPG